MNRYLFRATLYALVSVTAAALAALSVVALFVGGDVFDSLWGIAYGIPLTIAGARWFLQERDALLKLRGGRSPIALARPDAAARGMDFEGAAFGDPDLEFRGAPGRISAAEARRFAAALAALADAVEAAQAKTGGTE